MTDASLTRRRPWLVAVWPGMGQVALTAGYYLMSRLRMHETDPIPVRDLFDVEHVDVKDGVVRMGKLPQGRLFLWKDPDGPREGAVFIGEAQPPLGKHAFCARLLDAVGRLGVETVFTFAAMATSMHPSAPSRVLGVATHPESLQELRHHGVEMMPDGRITGLNGIFLAAAAERGIRGIGLLGEIPAFAAQLPFPKASAAVLAAFGRLAGLTLDLRELEEYGRTTEEQLVQILRQMQEALRQTPAAPQEEAETSEARPEPALAESEASPADRRRIEELFAQAARDRSKTFELKRELDRLGLFKEYEDRFLDLFRKPE